MMEANIEVGHEEQNYSEPIHAQHIQDAQDAPESPQSPEALPGIHRPALRALIDSATERMLADLSLGASGQLESYLGVIARFPRFSLVNQHLIFAQCPEATILGEFDAWSAHGYSIKRGSRALRLASGKAVVPLFDVSQTIPRVGAAPLPSFLPRRQSPFEIYEKLTSHLLAIGAIDPDYLADVRPESDPEAIVEEIEYFARGYADYLLETASFPRVEKSRISDCHVEAIAYVALRHLGLESVYPASDLEKWGQSPQALRQELEMVRRMALMMLAELATYDDIDMRGRRLRHVHYLLE